jgi:hypothetical protein
MDLTDHLIKSIFHGKRLQQRLAPAKFPVTDLNLSIDDLPVTYADHFRAAGTKTLLEREK